MILDLIGSYAKLSGYSFEKQQDDNFIDKLIRKFTAIIMVLFASIVSVYQLVGQPIQCWCQNEYTKPRCNYATTYCYITSFYIPVGNSTDLPKRDDLESHQILYYQWVPFIFVFQGFLFYFPSMVWRTLHSRSEFSLKDYMQTLKTNDDQAGINFVSHHIQTCIDFKENYQKRGNVKSLLKKALFFNDKNSFYLCFSYLFTKLIYLAVIIFQILVLNYWLKDEHYKGNFIFGYHNWRLSERFPRMTLCKFDVYILQDAQPHWVQCALPINIYIEKMYLIIWTWLWILLVLVLYDLIKICRNICCSQTKLLHADITTNKLLTDKQIEFLDEFRLSPDAFLVLNLIKWNTCKYNVTLIVRNLFDNMVDAHEYNERQKEGK